MIEHLIINKINKTKEFLNRKTPGQPDGWYWNLLPPFFSFIASILIRNWGRTLDMNVKGIEHLVEAKKQGGMIVGTWHGNMSPTVYLMKDKKLRALVSPHWFGELIVSVVKTLGYEFIRASSGYNAKEGLREILSSLKNGKTIAIMLDGPDGPAKHVNAGVVQMSMLSGKPIVVGFGAGTKFIRVNSWDKHEWPLPFSKVELHILEPIYIPRRCSKEQQEKYRLKIESMLHEAEKEVRATLAEYAK